jgi:hypothetical protein
MQSPKDTRDAEETSEKRRTLHWTEAEGCGAGVGGDGGAVLRHIRVEAGRKIKDGAIGALYENGGEPGVVRPY